MTSRVLGSVYPVATAPGSVFVDLHSSIMAFASEPRTDRNGATASPNILTKP